ncbi:MAG: MATE family efflux transporter [Peptostreptococcaceae bacterium]
MTKDMTTGSPVKLILYFSIPLLIGNIFQQFYSMVDTIIVGRFLGVNALAAVGSTGSLSFLIIGFVLGLTSGFSVLVSQRFGANDEEGIKKATGNAIILSVIFTIVITVISLILAKPILAVMNTPADIMNDAYAYVIVIFGGIFATFLYNLMASMLRALGDSKTPLYFLIVSSILNIILDLVFIVNFKMGVAGAAYATVISQGISGILCVIYTGKKFPILKLEKRHLKYDKEFVSQHIKIAVPMAVQFSIIGIGTIILQAAVNGFGSTVVAANTAAAKVEQLVMQPGISFGLTMATYCAQNLGAGNLDRIKEGVKKCAIINIVIGIVAGVVLVFFGPYFTQMFVSDGNPEVIKIAQQYLTTVGLFFIPLNMIFIFRNALQGMGHTFVPMMSGICELVARSIGAFTFPHILGYVGVCLAGPFAWIAAAVPLTIEYYKQIKIMTDSYENCSVEY